MSVILYDWIYVVLAMHTLGILYYSFVIVLWGFSEVSKNNGKINITMFVCRCEYTVL